MNTPNQKPQNPSAARGIFPRVLHEIVVGGLGSLLGVGFLAATLARPAGIANTWLLCYAALVCAASGAILCSRSYFAQRIFLVASALAGIQVSATVAFIEWRSAQTASGAPIELTLLAIVPFVSLMLFLLRKRFERSEREDLPSPSAGQRVIRAALLAIGSLGLLGAVGLSVFFVNPIWTQIRSLEWAQTRGTIRRSQVVPAELTETGRVGLDMCYEYDVNGMTIRGSRITAVPDTFLNHNEKSASELVELFPANSAVVVSYDPHHPRQAVLQAGIPGWLSICLLSMLFYLGLAFIYFRVVMRCEMDWSTGQAPTLAEIFVPVPLGQHFHGCNRFLRRHQCECECRQPRLGADHCRHMVRLPAGCQ